MGEHTVTTRRPSCYAPLMQRLLVWALAVLALCSLAACGEKKAAPLIPKDEEAKIQEEKCEDAEKACKQVRERIQLVRGCSDDSHCVMVPDTTRCGCFGGCAQVTNTGGSDTAIEMMRQAASVCDISTCPRPKVAGCATPRTKCVEGTCVDLSAPGAPSKPLVPLP